VNKLGKRCLTEERLDNTRCTKIELSLWAYIRAPSIIHDKCAVNQDTGFCSAVSSSAANLGQGRSKTTS